VGGDTLGLEMNQPQGGGARQAGDGDEDDEQQK
jgi:hypothetical protein